MGTLQEGYCLSVESISASAYKERDVMHIDALLFATVPDGFRLTIKSVATDATILVPRTTKPIFHCRVDPGQRLESVLADLLGPAFGLTGFTIVSREQRTAQLDAMTGNVPIAILMPVEGKASPEGTRRSGAPTITL